MVEVEAAVGGSRSSIRLLIGMQRNPTTSAGVIDSHCEGGQEGGVLLPQREADESGEHCDLQWCCPDDTCSTGEVTVIQPGLVILNFFFGAQ